MRSRRRAKLWEKMRAHIRGVPVLRSGLCVVAGRKSRFAQPLHATGAARAWWLYRSGFVSWMKGLHCLRYSTLWAAKAGCGSGTGGTAVTAPSTSGRALWCKAGGLSPWSLKTTM